MLRLRRERVPEPPLDRDEVLDIFGALADIYSDTRRIVTMLEEEAMKRKRMSPEERAADEARAQARIRRLREIEAKIQAEVDARREAAAAPRRRRLFGLL